MPVARLLLVVLMLGLGPTLAAQPDAACDATVQAGLSPDASPWERHQAAVRSLSGRLDPDAPCTEAASRPAARVAPSANPEGTAEVRQAWDRNAGAWDDTDRILRTVDADGRVTERVRQVPGGGGWQNTEQTLFASEGADQIQTEARWVDGAWQPARRTSYLYRDDQRSLGERRESWDLSAVVWRIDTQRTLAYDARDRQILVLNEALDPVSLQTVPVDRTQTAYAADDQERVALSQRWQAPDRWIDVSRTTDRLDSAGARLSITTDQRQAGTWVPDVRTLFVLEGPVDTVRTQAWNAGAGAWENTYQTLRTVAESGMSTLEANQAWVGGAWTNLSRQETEADGEGRLIAFTTSLWQAEAWVFQRRLMRTYTGDDLTAEVADRWDAGASVWRAVTDAAFEVTAAGLPLRSTIRAFQDDGTTVQSGTDTGWLYDASDRPTSRTTMGWDAAAQVWGNATRALLTYGLPPVAQEAGPAGRLAVSVRPNPMAGAGTVTVDALGAVRVDVFDVLGRRVAVLADGPLGSPLLGLPPLAPGTYVVRVTQGGDAVTQTITVVR